MVDDAASKPPGTVDDGYESPMSLWEQIRIVTHRMNFLLFRNMVYVNKFSLHGTCAQYLAGYMGGEDWRFNLINPDATSAYKVCEFGSDYLTTLNINHCHFGRRDAGYALVFGLMKLRTKASKKAE